MYLGGGGGVGGYLLMVVLSNSPSRSNIFVIFRNNPIIIKPNSEKNQISSHETEKFLMKTGKTNFCLIIHKMWMNVVFFFVLFFW